MSDQTYTGSFCMDGNYGSFSAQSGKFDAMFMGTPFYGRYEYNTDAESVGKFYVNESCTLPILVYKGIFSVDTGEPKEGTFWSEQHSPYVGNFAIGLCMPYDMGKSWHTLLSKEIVKEYYRELLDLIEYERSQRVLVSPQKDLIYTWSKQCSVDEVKVVIVGQDPYPGEGNAHGLAFSMDPAIQVPERSSLHRIFEAINWDYEQLHKEKQENHDPFVPKHGCLIGWAKQGVLLLNTMLTLQQYRKECTLTLEEHEEVDKQIKKGWKAFTDQVIKYLSDNKFGLVFMLWGDVAKKKLKHIDKKKHHILQGSHPSPRPNCQDFIHCRHFTECNKLLEKHGKRPIDWLNFE